MRRICFEFFVLTIKTEKAFGKWIG